MSQHCRFCSAPHSAFDVDCPACGKPLDETQGDGPEENQAPRIFSNLIGLPHTLVLTSREQADYEVVEQIRVRQGLCYLLRDLHLQRHAVLWSSTQPEVQRTLEPSNSSHLATVYQSWAEQDQFYRVFAWNPEIRLTALITHAPPDAELARKWAAKIASAMAAAHENGLVGWRLDPDWIGIDDAGRLRLAPVLYEPEHKSKQDDLEQIAKIITALFTDQKIPKMIANILERCQRGQMSARQAGDALTSPGREERSRFKALRAVGVLIPALLVYLWIDPSGIENSPGSLRTGISLAGLSDRIGDPRLRRLRQGLTETLGKSLNYSLVDGPYWLLPNEEESTQSGRLLARQQGVRWILGGHLTNDDGQYLMTLSLIEAESSRQIDQRTIAAPGDDTRLLVQRMTQVAHGLLGIPEKIPIRYRLEPYDDRIFRHYLEGLGYLRQTTPAHLAAAERAFTRVLNQNKHFHDARAGLLSTFLARYDLTEEPAYLARAEQTIAAIDEHNKSDLNMFTALTWVRQGRIPIALEMLEEIALTHEIQLERARLYRQVNQTEKAENTYKEILSTTPGHIPALLALYNLYSAQNHPKEAAAIKNELKRFAPEHPILF